MDGGGRKGPLLDNDEALASQATSDETFAAASVGSWTPSRYQSKPTQAALCPSTAGTLDGASGADRRFQ